ncbi:MAG: peptidase M64 [Planctomycetes bacterium]|nr:peptidase M64 [Planctomycetota bacterium]
MSALTALVLAVLCQPIPQNPVPVGPGPTAAPAGSAAAFATHFEDRVLRIDLFHTGRAGEEFASVDRIRTEGQWPGNKARLIDGTGLGLYRVVVRDASTDTVLYTQGFCSVFGEWVTTDEAKLPGRRTFAEAVRIPEPKAPIVLALEKRDARQQFVEWFRTTIDPKSLVIERQKPVNQDVLVIVERGDPSSHVDLLLLGDGYTAAEKGAFRADAERLVRALFATEPYKTHAGKFNVRAIAPPSPKSGISKPRQGEWRQSALGATFNTFDSDRYVLLQDDRRWRDVAAAAPYDTVVVLLNERKYGGGGIFRLYSTAAARSEVSEYLFVHEFGHSFAALADEYFTSPVAYSEFTPPQVEPWETNVTALLDPAQLKWKDLVKADTPLPTPWDKDAFTTLSKQFQQRRADLVAKGAKDEELEALFAEEKAATKQLLDAELARHSIGAYEGAMYQARGLYRPEVDCVMFSRNRNEFCAVCARSIERVIEELTAR